MPNPIPVSLTKNGVTHKFKNMKLAEGFLKIDSNSAMIRHYLKINKPLHGYKIEKL